MGITTPSGSTTPELSGGFHRVVASMEIAVPVETLLNEMEAGLWEQLETAGWRVLARPLVTTVPPLDTLAPATPGEPTSRNTSGVSIRRVAGGGWLQ